MGLTYATTIFVLSILGWVGLVIMEYFASSLLCSQIAYVFLVLGLIHLASTSLAVSSREVSQAYFSSVLAFSLYVIGCMADAFPIYTFSPEKFALPPGSPKCCANLDVVRTNRVLFFTDSILFYVQAGVFLGYILIHLLLAGAGSFDVETQSVWPGHTWGLALLVLLSVRFFILFNNMVVMLCPDMLFYLHIFEQPIVPLRWIYIASSGLFLALLLAEGLPWNSTAWIYWRALQLILCAGFFGASVAVLYVRGMLTVAVIVVLVVPFVPIAVALVQSILKKIMMDREEHERMVRDFMARQREYAPSAPPLQPANGFPPLQPLPPSNAFPPLQPANAFPSPQPANPFRYYIPMPLHVARDKKGL